jgi:hypothetical protein
MHGRKKFAADSDVDDAQQKRASRQLETLKVLQYRDMFSRIRDKVCFVCMRANQRRVVTVAAAAKHTAYVCFLAERRA